MEHISFLMIVKLTLLLLKAHLQHKKKFNPSFLLKYQVEIPSSFLKRFLLDQLPFREKLFQAQSVPMDLLKMS